MGVPKCKKASSGESNEFKQGFAKGNGDVLNVFYALLREEYEWSNEQIKDYSEYVFHAELYKDTAKMTEAFNKVKAFLKLNNYNKDKGMASKSAYKRGRTKAEYESIVILFSVLAIRENWEYAEIGRAITKFFSWYRAAFDPTLSFNIGSVEKILKDNHNLVISRVEQ